MSTRTMSAPSAKKPRTALLEGEALHHAYILEGVFEEIVPELTRELEKRLDVSFQGNPNVFSREYDTFGIDDAHELVRRASLKEVRNQTAQNGVSGERKIFIIAARSLTRDAENALLKLLEDPTAHTHFFIIVPSAQTLLPTLISRTVVISRVHRAAGEEMGNFMRKTHAERLKYVEKVLASEDVRDAHSFLNALEVYMRQKTAPHAMTDDTLFVFKEIQKCRDYAGRRGASLKTLLEHIALITPVV